jgi:hypothetical protein
MEGEKRSSTATQINYFALLFLYILFLGARGRVVAKAPRYKPAGRGFDSR